MFRFRLLVFFGAASLTVGAVAGTPSNVSTTSLGTITVTAPTGTPQSLGSTLAPILFLDSRQFSAFSGTDIASVLQFHAGLDIAREGGAGQPVSLFLRGAGSAETLVLVDGIQVNPGAIGAAPFANIRSNGIDTVQVVETPHSALYGSDAIGGVVAITLAKPRRRGLAWGFDLFGGHDATRGASAHFGGGDGTAFGGVSASWMETAGFPPLVASHIAAAYRNSSVHAVFGAYGVRGTAYATLWQSSGTSDYLNFFGNPRSEQYTDRVVSVHLSRQVNPAWHSRLLLGQFFDGIEQIQSADFTHSWRNSLDWRNDIKVNGHQLLTIGTYLAHEHVNALSFGVGYDAPTSQQALYAQDQLQYGKSRFVLAGRESHFSSFGDQFTWNTDYGFRFADVWRLTIGAGTGFRAPPATDRFGYGGNPYLKPETSHSLNAGLYRWLGPHAVVGLNLYKNRITNLITFEATNAGGEEQNVGKATITGANLTARLRFGSWDVNPAINIQRPVNDRLGQYLPRRSRKSVTLNITYDVAQWRAGFHLLAVGPRKDSDFSTAVDAGYALTDLTGSLWLTPHLQLRGRIENLFDISYQTAAGYRSPGRGLYLSLHYEGL